ncbi:MAG: hypothetical protein GF311_26315 [Candidatus Lokiarchaeota archaeon]|nr:hypothetical protein [Candidatus Lokiarchaeota archaeon]
MRRYKKKSEFKYIIWYENEGKGSIKNTNGETMWYNSKYAFEGARLFAKDKNKKVLVQKGYNVWRVTPDGNQEQIQK